MHMAGEMSAAHRIVSSQVNSNITASTGAAASYPSNGGAKPASATSSFVPRSVVKKQQQQARVAVSSVTTTPAPTTAPPPMVVSLSGLKGVHQNNLQTATTAASSTVATATGTNKTTATSIKADDGEDLDSDLEDFLKDLDDDDE